MVETKDIYLGTLIQLIYRFIFKTSNAKLHLGGLMLIASRLFCQTKEEEKGGSVVQTYRLFQKYVVLFKGDAG